MNESAYIILICMILGIIILQYEYILTLKYTKYRYYIWVPLIIIYIIYSATIDILIIKENRIEYLYTVKLVDETTNKDCILLGTRSKYQIYKCSENKIFIIPTENIIYIEQVKNYNYNNTVFSELKMIIKKAIKKTKEYYSKTIHFNTTLYNMLYTKE